MNNSLKKINLYLPAALIERLNVIANKKGITKVSLIRNWIKETSINNFKVDTTNYFSFESKYDFLIEAEEYQKLGIIKQALNLSISDVIRSIISLNIDAVASSRINFSISDGVDNINDIRKIYDDIVASPLVKSFVNAELSIKFFPENMDKFGYYLEKKRGNVKNLLVNNSGARKFFLKHSWLNNYGPKYLPDDISFMPINYLLYKDKVTIVNLHDEKLSAITFSDKSMYKLADSQFDFIWNNSHN